MKKRIFYILFISLIFSIPSMVQAEDTGQLTESFSIEKSSSSQSFLGIHKLTNLIDGLGSLIVKDSESAPSVQANQTEEVSDTLPTETSEVLKTPNPETVETVIDSVEGVVQKAPEEVLQAGSEVLNVNLGLGTIGKVGVELVSLPTITETGELTGQSGLLGLNVTDSVLLGNVELGLLSNSKNLTEDGFVSDSSLVDLGISNSLLNTNVDVLESSKIVTGDTNTFSSSLVSAGVSAPLIGELNTTIGGLSGLISPDRNELHTGLVSADINNDILGNNHVGIIEQHVIETEEGKTVSGGLVIVDGTDTPVGDIHVGVGEIGNPSVIDISPNPTYPIPPESKDDSESGTNQDSIVPGGNQTDLGDSTSGNGEFGIGDIFNPDKSLTEPSPTKQVDEAVNTTQELALETQNLELTNGDTSEVDQFLKMLLDVGNQTILKQGIDEVTQFGSEIEKLNEKSANTTGVTSLSAPSSTTSSTSTGSASISGGSATSVVLNSANNLEMSLQRQTQNVLKTLSTQWSEAPPVQPPIAPFFLAR